MKFNSWYNAAKFCEETFGSYVEWSENFFICPDCGEPIYLVDWEDHDSWGTCPVCECVWEEIE